TIGEALGAAVDVAGSHLTALHAVGSGAGVPAGAAIGGVLTQIALAAIQARLIAVAPAGSAGAECADPLLADGHSMGNVAHRAAAGAVHGVGAAVDFAAILRHPVAVETAIVAAADDTGAADAGRRAARERPAGIGAGAAMAKVGHEVDAHSAATRGHRTGIRARAFGVVLARRGAKERAIAAHAALVDRAVVVLREAGDTGVAVG